MNYWLIYYDDFSNSGWVIKAHACFISKNEAEVHFETLWNDEFIWWHLMEVTNGKELDPIFIVSKPKSHFLRLK